MPGVDLNDVAALQEIEEPGHAGSLTWKSKGSTH